MKLQAFIPLVTYPEANSDAVVANATSVAEWLGADLHAVALNPDFPSISNPFSSLLLNVPEMIRDAETASRKRGRHLLDGFQERAAASAVGLTSDELRADVALLAESAASHARYFDISLLGWESGNDMARTTAESVVFGSGRPAILLPELSVVGSLDHLMIAWDGSRVAARAVADAQPFLRRASRISVLTVLDEKPLKEEGAGERLAHGLRKRGFSAEPVAVRGEDCPIAQTLQQAALERGCDLLVMGAYGHPRIRDFVLGGATQGVLGELLLPVLLSH